MQWKDLQSEKQLSEIIAASSASPKVLFKHSTRCGISAMIKQRLERQWDMDGQPFLLLIPQYRHLSNQVASIFNVRHESPQVIIIYEEKCIYHASHADVCTDAVEKILHQTKD